MKTISAILAELKDSNPELGHLTASALNNMLLSKGLICTVKDGKVPTQRGEIEGIQKKVNKDDMGRRICYPVYTEQGERYVKALAVQHFAGAMPRETESAPPEVASTRDDAPSFPFHLLTIFLDICVDGIKERCVKFPPDIDERVINVLERFTERNLKIIILRYAED